MYGTGTTTSIRKCRVCLCSEDQACMPGSCYWVSKDLCSECVKKNPQVATPEELLSFKNQEGLI